MISNIIGIIISAALTIITIFVGTVARKVCKRASEDGKIELLDWAADTVVKAAEQLKTCRPLMDKLTYAKSELTKILNQHHIVISDEEKDNCIQKCVLELKTARAEIKSADINANKTVSK